MGYNLYYTMRRLLEESVKWHRIIGILKFDAEHKAEFKQAIKKYNEVEAKLDYIKENCIISPLMVSKIISKREEREYVLKIFRETDMFDSKCCYTGQFLACYLNSDNKYFDYDIDGKSFVNLNGVKGEQYVNYPLPREQFEELLYSLPSTNSYVLATSEEQTFKPVLPPSSYLEDVNFLEFFTKGRVDDFVSFNLPHRIKYDLKDYLEEIDSDEFFKGMEKKEEDQA